MVKIITIPKKTPDKKLVPMLLFPSTPSTTALIRNNTNSMENRKGSIIYIIAHPFQLCQLPVSGPIEITFVLGLNEIDGNPAPKDMLGVVD